MNIKKNFLTASFFDLISKVSMGLLTVILIRILNKEEYSNYILFQSFTLILVSTIVTGFNIALLRYESSVSRLAVKKSYFKFNFIILSVILILIFFASTGIFLFNDGSKTLFIFVLSSLYAVLLGIIKLNQTYYQANNDFKTAGLIQNINNLILLVFVLIAIFTISDKINFNYIGTIYIVSSFILVVFTSKKIINSLSETETPSSYELKHYIKASAWLLVYTVFLGLMNQVDIMLIKYILSDEELASYGVAFRYYSLLLTLLPSLIAVLRVRMAQEDMVSNLEKQKKFTYQWMKLSIPISLLMVVLMTSTSKYYMPILNGAEYNNSIIVFNIFVIGVGISYIFSPIVTIMVARKKYKTLAFLGGLGLIFNVISNILLIPRFGIGGAAVTTIIAQSIINIGSTIIVLKERN